MKRTPTIELRKRTILVADDIREIRLAFQAVLEDDGYAVVAGENGKDAIDKFLKYQPDAAVLDLRLPDMSGIDVCRYIRERSSIPARLEI